MLYACLAAFGPAPTFWVVAMAYLVGMLANSMPVPGGFLAVEGGLVGMLLLFDVRPASLVIAAVVVYRAISLWLPALIGSVAFLSLRRDIGKPVAPVARWLACGDALGVGLLGGGLLADVARQRGDHAREARSRSARRGRGRTRAAAAGRRTIRAR